MHNFAQMETKEGPVGTMMKLHYVVNNLRFKRAKIAPPTISCMLNLIDTTISQNLDLRIVS